MVVSPDNQAALLRRIRGALETVAGGLLSEADPEYADEPDIAELVVLQELLAETIRAQIALERDEAGAEGFLDWVDLEDASERSAACMCEACRAQRRTDAA